MPVLDLPDLALRCLVVALALGASAHAARADLMTACAPEVRALCADVDEGRGRVSACLAGYMDRLGPACLPEVRAVAQSRMMPGDVRRLFQPGFRVDLPQACEVEAAQLCPGVATGDGRVFACLYAHTDQVGPVCSVEAKAALRAAN
jgi:hypothetical protein